MIRTRLQLTAIMFVALLGLSFVAAQPVLAQCVGGANRSILGFPTWDQYLDHNAVDCHITGFDFPGDLFLVLVALVEIMIRLAAYIATGFVIYGAFKLMAARGQPDKIAEARSTITNAIIGLAISILAVAIISYTASRF